MGARVRPRGMSSVFAAAARRNAAVSSYTIRVRMVRFLTAGESHGRALVVILEGIPAGLPIDLDSVTRDLNRRQGGYGRGRRMAIESDRADILSGVRARRDDRRPDRHAHREPRLGELAADDVHRARAGAGRDGRQSRAGDAAAARSCRSGRCRQVRARRRARHPRAGQRPRDRGAGRRRRRSPGSCCAAAGIRITSHVFSIGSVHVPDGTTVSFDAGGGAARRLSAPLRR